MRFSIFEISLWRRLEPASAEPASRSWSFASAVAEPAPVSASSVSSWPVGRWNRRRRRCGRGLLLRAPAWGRNRHRHGCWLRFCTGTCRLPLERGLGVEPRAADRRHDPRADEERVTGRDLSVEQQLLVLAEQVVLAKADATADVGRLVVERRRDHPRVLVLGEDVNRDTAGLSCPVHLDVLEQAARDEARLDDVGHLGGPVVADLDVRDQLDGVRGRLGVVLDDDLLDRGAAGEIGVPQRRARARRHVRVDALLDLEVRLRSGSRSLRSSGRRCMDRCRRRCWNRCWCGCRRRCLHGRRLLLDRHRHRHRHRHRYRHGHGHGNRHRRWCWFGRRKLLGRNRNRCLRERITYRTRGDQ